VFIETELMNGGTLADLIKKFNDDNIPIDKREGLAS